MSLERNEAEAAEAQILYDLISANWEHMFEVKDPLDIEAEIKVQKQKCDQLLAQKDVLIEGLKNDLKMMDEAYYEDLDKQVPTYLKQYYVSLVD